MLEPNGVPILIRRTHEERILSVLRDSGPLPRSTIESRVGLSRTTVSEITGNLLARGALVEMGAEEANRGRGRPAVRLALDPTAGQFLGIDFAHRRVFVAAVNASNEVIGAGAVAYDEDADWQARVDSALGLVARIEGDTGIRFGALEGVGIGVPGPVGTDGSGRSQRWGGAANADGIRLVKESFGARLGAPILVDNNTRFAGLAEAVWGPAHDIDSLLYLRLGDGVGGGLVVGGRLVAGAFGRAGEVGHVAVAGENTQCWCGKRGCLETVASAPALVRSARRHVGSVDSVAGVFAHLDVPGVRTEVVRAAKAVGSILAAITTVVDPRRVVVAGEALQHGSLFFDELRAEFSRAAVQSPDGQAVLRVSTLGDEAGALGAIAAAFHRSPLLAGFPTLTDASQESVVAEGAHASLTQSKAVSR